MFLEPNIADGEVQPVELGGGAKCGDNKQGGTWHVSQF